MPAVNAFTAKDAKKIREGRQGRPDCRDLRLLLPSLHSGSFDQVTGLKPIKTDAL
jgi:hypothetical protein